MLRRGIGPFDALMLVVGSMIGSGIFLVSAESGRLLGSPVLLLCAWGVAGGLTLLGASVCAELAVMLPEAGGPYVFLREAFGELPAFLYGWTLILVIQTGTIAAVATAFAKFLAVFVPGLPVQACAALLVIVLTAANARGLRAGTRVQNVLTVAKITAFAVLVAACLAHRGNAGSALASPFRKEAFAPTGWALLPAFAAALVGPLFSQSAWNNVTFAGGEVRDPQRSLRQALLGGCALVSGLYLLANLGYEHVLSFSALVHAPGERVAAVAAEVLWPGWGARLMAAAILVSTAGCANGLVLSGARVVYAMARAGQLPATLGSLNRAQVPGRALFVQGLWAVLLVLSGTYSSLLRYVISAELLCYAATAAALVALRKRRVLPLSYISVMLLLAVLLAIKSPWTSLLGWLLVASGVPVFVFLL